MGASSIAIPLSALFPPSPTSPPAVFPTPSFALLGPLPPTSPLHLALDYIALSALPDYTETSSEVEAGGLSVRRKERALIVTGPRATWTEDIMEEDEDHLRIHGSGHSMLSRLGRIDTRACPTSAHLKLFLTLLGSARKDDRTIAPPENAVVLEDPPGVIILWDIARLFMEQPEPDENRPPGQAGAQMDEWQWKYGVSLSDYMEVLSAAKAIQEHFSSLRPSDSPTQLIILEPHLDRLSSLPILHSSSELRQNLTTPTRNKRMSVKKAIEWIFGDVVGLIEREGMVLDGVEARYTVSLPTEDEVFHAVKRPCAKNDFAPRHRARDIEDDQAWRWGWDM